MTEVVGIDHIYITVSDLNRSEVFYDHVLLEALGFRKNKFTLGGDPHVQYFNRHFGYVLRPARTEATHDSYSPGLHHFCLRVDSADEVAIVAAQLRGSGIDASEAKLYLLNPASHSRASFPEYFKKAASGKTTAPFSVPYVAALCDFSRFQNEFVRTC